MQEAVLPIRLYFIFRLFLVLFIAFVHVCTLTNTDTYSHKINMNIQTNIHLVFQVHIVNAYTL